ncbi:hypothetical protein Droror1_Dr00016009 [Drosera rotundifolia]
MEKENGNDRDSDFTFCQVAAPGDQNGLGIDKAILDVSNITIRNEALGRSIDGQASSTSLPGKDTPPNKTAPYKEENVGSLSFRVFDAMPNKLTIEASRETASASTVNSVSVVPKQKTVVQKPKARAKVPFEKGYSQMDWLKLTRTHPDLAGLEGKSNRRLIPISEVKQHQTEGSMWTVLKGRVYNIAPYMKFHPGGVDMLMKAVGKDCTLLFNKYHAWVNAEFMLEKCLVGFLDESS